MPSCIIKTSLPVYPKPKNFSKRFFAGCLLSALVLLFSACASQPPSAKPEQAPQAPTGGTPDAPPALTLDGEAATKITPDAPSFPPETLYSLILAEIAAQRNRLDVTLSQYVQQAHDTRDPGVVARANRIARYLGSHKSSLNTALLWTELEPQSIEARQVVITELLHYRRYPEAIENINRLLDYSSNLNFDHLIENAQHMTPSDRALLITHFQPLTLSHADSASTWFTYALLLKQNNQTIDALAATEKALKLEPAYASAMITKATLLHQLGKQKQALKWIKKSSSRLPNNTRLRIVYARMLIDAKQYKKAQAQFSILVKESPNNGDLILSLAILSFENDLPEQAESYLKRLIDLNQRTNDAHFFLGELYRSKNQIDTALTHYEAVKTGGNLLNARAAIASLLNQQGKLTEALQSLQADRILYPDFAIQLYTVESSLLAENKQYEESLRVLSEALQKHPDNTTILYNRAMLGEKLNQFALFESDLKTIIKKEPENAVALNALGYTLANRSERLKEALGYITKAIELNPNDPAIMDSMGWVHYRLGNYDEALDYLRSALKVMNDHEIAAHLGEVLWVTGHKDEARKVWKEALKVKADSLPLKAVIEKYDPK